VRQAALVGRSRAGAARSAPPGRSVVRFPRRRRFRRHPPHPARWRLLALLIALALVVAAIWETQTSSLTMEPGPNPQTAFPVSGPFDERRGYTRIPEFRDSLEARSYRITEQARQSPALARLIRSGIAPPFREPPVTGLVIHDADGITLFDPTADHRVFRRFEDVPRSPRSYNAASVGGATVSASEMVSFTTLMRIATEIRFPHARKLRGNKSAGDRCGQHT
jgi:hypothetical protein